MKRRNGYTGKYAPMLDGRGLYIRGMESEFDYASFDKGDVILTTNLLPSDLESEDEFFDGEMALSALTRMIQETKTLARIKNYLIWLGSNGVNFRTLGRFYKSDGDYLFNVYISISEPIFQGPQFKDFDWESLNN